MMIELTEEEYLRELDKVALRVYGNHYNELCESRQRAAITLFETGDF